KLSFLFVGRFLKRLFEEYDLFGLLIDKYRFPEPVANIFADFLDTLLTYTPGTRPTALDCLNHPFMEFEYSYSAFMDLSRSPSPANSSHSSEWHHDSSKRKSNSAAGSRPLSSP